MGKGYNNYMCKKPFHPGSKANIKRAWMAEQKTENEKKKQEELKVQYEKEQDLYNNRALLSTESKDKLELNFMYEAPPGAKRERQKEDDEPEFKFEWQRKYNAPREDYAKGNADIKDQPFGIPVRNVRCIKCHKWGHINTDKECPLFAQASTSSMPTTSMDPMELMRQMREDGYGLKENVLGHQLNPKAANQQFIPSEDESDPEMEFLKSLSAPEKKKLLRKLKKLSKKQEKATNCKKKKSKKSGKSRSKDKTDSNHSKKDKEESGDSSSEESVSEDKKKYAKNASKQSKRKRDTSQSSESESEESRSKHAKSEKSSHHSKKGKSQEKLISKSKPDSSKLRRTYSDSENESLRKGVKSSDPFRSKHSKHVNKDNLIYNQSRTTKSSNSESFSSEGETEKSISRRKQNKKSSSKDKIVNKNKCSNSLLDDPETQYTKSEKFDKSHKNYKSVVVSSKPCKHSHSEKRDKKNNEKSKKVENEQKMLEDTSKSSDPQCSSPQHPDGFSHLCPQAKIEANYLQCKEEYLGKLHDIFRHCHRERRSPSVKQKYNK